MWGSWGVQEDSVIATYVRIRPTKPHNGAVYLKDLLRGSDAPHVQYCGARLVEELVGLTHHCAASTPHHPCDFGRSSLDNLWTPSHKRLEALKMRWLAYVMRKGHSNALRRHLEHKRYRYTPQLNSAPPPRLLS